MQNFSAVHGAVLDKTNFNASCNALQVTAENCVLGALTVLNKSASDIWLQIYDSASGATGTRRQYPLPANSYFNLVNKRFGSGLYVRGVTAVGGSSLVGATDLEIDADFITHPVSSATP